MIRILQLLVVALLACIASASVVNVDPNGLHGKKWLLARKQRTWDDIASLEAVIRYAPRPPSKTSLLAPPSSFPVSLSSDSSNCPTYLLLPSTSTSMNYHSPDESVMAAHFLPEKERKGDSRYLALALQGGSVEFYNTK